MSDTTEEPRDHDCLEIGIFSALDPDVRLTFAELGTVVEMPVGTHVTKQGEPQGAMSVILSGSVSVSVHAHGDTIKLAEIKEGGLVGEMSLFDRQHASADVVVTGVPATLWSIDYDAFDRFMESEPQLAIKVYHIIAAELCRLLRCNSEKMLNREDQMRSRFLDMDY